MVTSSISTLRGLVLTSIDVTRNGAARQLGDEIVFTTTDGRRFRMWHEQDVTEGVWIEDICGDVQDLVGAPILVAEERTQEGDLADGSGIYTWTFYELATIRGSVTIRWNGEAEGFYYSTSVSFAEIT